MPRNIEQTLINSQHILEAMMEFQSWLKEEKDKIFGMGDVSDMDRLKRLLILNEVSEKYYEILYKHTENDMEENCKT